MLVGIHDQWISFALGDMHRHNLVFKPPGFDGRSCPPLALKSISVLFFSANAHLVVDVFRGFTHPFQWDDLFHLLVRVTPSDGCVVHCDVSPRKCTSGFGYGPWRPAHALNTPSDEDISLSTLNSPGSLVDGVQPRGAQTVDGDAGYIEGQPGQDHCHSGHVSVIFPRLIGTTEVHILNEFRGNSRSRYDFLNDERGHIIRSNG